MNTNRMMVNIVYYTCYRPAEFTPNTAAGFILIQAAITKWSIVDSSTIKTRYTHL